MLRSALAKFRKFIARLPDADDKFKRFTGASVPPPNVQIYPKSWRDHLMPFLICRFATGIR
jgi:hypothetical protein